MDYDEMKRRLKLGESAIDLSIEKWDKISKNEGIEDGLFNCALCELYHTNDCTECPIKQETGDVYCRNTPYQVFTKHVCYCPNCYEDTEAMDFDYCEEAQELAKDMVKYLKDIKEKTGGIVQLTGTAKISKG